MILDIDSRRQDKILERPADPIEADAKPPFSCQLEIKLHPRQFPFSPHPSPPPPAFEESFLRVAVASNTQPRFGKEKKINNNTKERTGFQTVGVFTKSQSKGFRYRRSI
ncbi:hypothetical protein PoB_006478200 [Plakobranchus ocellatus]|uniref:Uncharacterized protein n=1 Tax=Plakobranchus ocellatus TaxID=259542 RepID=A0AAV4D282_9GAST|nr:hypothetical protein PoB_006478200 [Plakobranchus ocellatus]